jgi:hypothetical protein
MDDGGYIAALCATSAIVGAILATLLMDPLRAALCLFVGAVVGCVLCAVLVAAGRG